MSFTDYWALDFDSLMALFDPSFRGARGGAVIELLATLESDTLITLLRHPDHAVGSHAALALGGRKEGRVVSELIKLLDDDSITETLGRSVAWALGELGDERAVEPLIAALDKKNIGGWAIEALVKLRDERAVEPLIRVFRRNHDPSVATVLGNWGDRRAVDALIEAMSDPYSHTRFYAARALGKLGDEHALPVLEWARHHDTEPITDSESIRGKSVSHVAAKAIEKIKTAGGAGPPTEAG